MDCRIHFPFLQTESLQDRRVVISSSLFTTPHVAVLFFLSKMAIGHFLFIIAISTKNFFAPLETRTPTASSRLETLFATIFMSFLENPQISAMLCILILCLLTPCFFQIIGSACFNSHATMPYSVSKLSNKRSTVARSSITPSLHIAKSGPFKVYRLYSTL